MCPSTPLKSFTMFTFNQFRWNRFNSTFTHNLDTLRGYFRRPSGLSLTPGGMVVNGTSVANIISVISDPAKHLTRELTRWSVDILFPSWDPRTWNYELIRKATLRELFDTFLTHVLGYLKKFKLFALLCLQKGPAFLKASLVLVFLNLLVRLGASLIAPKNYVKIDPFIIDGVPVPAVHRPASLAAVNYFRDPYQYPPESKEKAESLLEELQALRDQDAFVANMACPECKFAYMDCTCDPAGVAIKNVIPRRQYSLRKRAIKRELTLLSSPDRRVQYQYGNIFKLPIASSYVLTLLEPFGISARLVYKITNSFLTCDQRPSTEKHIDLSNSRYFVVRSRRHIKIKMKLFFKTYCFKVDRKFLSWFCIPSRDLIVAEDHLRLTRRGNLSSSFDVTLKGQLETSLAVPINDPVFTRYGVNPVKDVFYLVRSLHNACTVPYEHFL